MLRITTAARRPCAPAGHRREDRFPRATRGLAIWAVWWASQDERGWPSYSTEVAALQRSMTATNVQGAARHVCQVASGPVLDGAGALVRDGRAVPSVPPPMPKETRATAGPRVPPIDGARLGPQVHRHLWDLEQVDRAAALAVQAYGLHPRGVPATLAEALGFKVRRYEALVTLGLVWLEARLSWTPKGE